MIKIRGNIGTQGNTAIISIDPQFLAEQLPKVDKEKLRKGDKVWVEAIMDDDTGILMPLPIIGAYLLHIPAPQEQEKEGLPEEIDLSKYNSHYDSGILAERVNQLIRWAKEQKCTP